MTATVHDLISARERRGRNPLHFEDDVEAITWVQAQIAEVRDQSAGVLLIPTASLDVRLAQVSAVLAAIGDLYQRDEKGTQ
ncbi:hypothetical protein [Nocardioides sp.]|uniref:hypothetical protein n=1 Tax=Nocardioides sp. TaxID=35761 RepID=UPI002BA9A507|nr:hypothetical protein [Nocardioides sp.]HXH78177.1 hypothetical protein [Nocardioides sp.]